MSEVSIVYVNTADGDEARRIGRALVEARLAAAANVLPAVSSVFRWQGEIRERPEAILILKTRTDLVGRAVETIRAMHGYACPSILAVPVQNGNPDYLAWVSAETVDAG